MTNLNSRNRITGRYHTLASRERMNYLYSITWIDDSGKYQGGLYRVNDKIAMLSRMVAPRVEFGKTIHSPGAGIITFITVTSKC